MIIIRPLTSKDTTAFIDIAFTAGLGMTSIPKNRTILEEQVGISQRSFAKVVDKPGDERYLFVLENLDSNVIEGTCCILANTTYKCPLYFYKIEPPSESNNNLPMLRPTKYDSAPTEICSLYLMPTSRHSGQGRLLSLSRFLFIACHRHRFESTIYAEMRGYADTHQISPFWEGIGRHFLEMEYSTLMHLHNEANFDIHRLLPAYPIYIPLLPQEVQEVIQQVHPHTQAALDMLLQEGFHVTNEVDVCDAGPKIEVTTDTIRCIKESVVDIVRDIVTQPIDAPRYLVSNTKIDFRACFAAVGKVSSGGVVITREIAAALQITLGDTIRYVLAHSEKGHGSI